ncbi:alpha/beta fold hydrolase [Nocardia niwae]|uniref:Alpha/beta hydrolase n=1 Tax=Nocardia niwae TaxID=626084 RepID=A0ABV2X6X9_9NOCA
MTAKEPLLLLHGVTMSANVWCDVAGLMTEFDLIIPTAPGHRGGPRMDGPASISKLVDHAERLLDGKGLKSVHIAGNSLGGWVAIELARRGRARSVCAFSPAGFWTDGTQDKAVPTGKIRHAMRVARRAEPIVPLLFGAAWMRRFATREVAQHGDRLSRMQAVAIVQDMIECDAADDLLNTAESVAPLHDLPCPITLAWADEDRIFPPEIHGITARSRIPGGRYVALRDVGHVPMIDDPGLCAATIRAAVETSV